MAKKATPTAAPHERGNRMVKVRATQMGYYDHVRRRVGDVFLIPETLFSARWMVVVPSGTPENITTSPQHMKRSHDEILGGRTLGILTPPDDAPDTVTNRDDNPLGAD